MEQIYGANLWSKSMILPLSYSYHNGPSGASHSCIKFIMFVLVTKASHKVLGTSIGPSVTEQIVDRAQQRTRKLQTLY